MSSSNKTGPFLVRNDEAARLLFVACDRDRDGFITRADLASLCEELHLQEPVEALLAQLGVAKGGKISFEDFLRQQKREQLNRINAAEEAETDEIEARRNRNIRRSKSADRGLSGKKRFLAALTPFGRNNNNSKASNNTKTGSDSAADLDSAPSFGDENLLLRGGGPSSSSTTISSHQQQRPAPNLAQLANSIHMSAVASLQNEIEDLTSRLQQVSRERDQLMSKFGENRAEEEEEEDEDNNKKTPEGSQADSWEMQCQRYEDRIVELHSVIAELTRKLDDQRDDVIREESEFDEEEVNEKDEEEHIVDDTQSFISDSCEAGVEDDDDEDYTSLVFERDLDRRHHSDASKFSSEIFPPNARDFESEIFTLQRDLNLARDDNEKMREALAAREAELARQKGICDVVAAERDALKRQVEDIKATVEFQEARMDQQQQQRVASPPSSSANSRSSSERRSLRRRRNAGCDRDESKQSSSISTISPLDQAYELGLELDRAKTRCEHLRSQNEVLSLTLEDSKSLTDRLSVLLGRHESNNTALQLALNYCDQMVESYDVLVALLETESGVLNASTAAAADRELRQASLNRKSAETVARHLLNRVDKSFNRSDSGLGNNNKGVSPTSRNTWEDSSGYSQTTSSTSTTSSCLADLDFTKSDEFRLRDHISSLKTIRSSIQSSIVELEPLHADPDVRQSSSSSKQQQQQQQLDLETAVLHQELMGSKEEIADLRAKVYVLEKEKSGQELMLSDRVSVEQILREHIQHLQEELGRIDGGNMHLQQQRRAAMKVDSSREAQLKQRVENLLQTLNKVTANSEVRQKQSGDLIDDLKRANSTLTEALEKSKRKYQAKIRRLEQQILLEKKSAAVVLDAEKPQRFKSSIPVTVKANNGVK